MSPSLRKSRILALDPGTKEMGFALLNEDILIRYGVRNIKARYEKQGNRKAPGIDLIKSYKPDVLILGALIHTQRKSNPVLKNLTNHIKQFALKKGVEVNEIDPAEARRYLIQDSRPTKMNAAALIISVYPELLPYLPKKGRILWTPRDKYWMNMFDALTLGLYYLQESKRKKDATRNLNVKRNIT